MSRAANTSRLAASAAATTGCCPRVASAPIVLLSRPRVSAHAARKCRTCRLLTLLALGALRRRSDNTKGCYDVINNAKPIMVEACKAVLEARAKRGAKAAKEPFVVADYGAADGACVGSLCGRRLVWAAIAAPSPASSFNAIPL